MRRAERPTPDAEPVSAAGRPHLTIVSPSTAPEAATGAGSATLALYTLTMFTSATLLFLVQPMFARMVLPLLGGSAAVWNTAMVFYQVTLLAGYLYAHATTRWLPLRFQVGLHAVVLLLPLLVLPIAVPGGWSPPTEGNPIPWLLALLGVAVGLPFFVVSTSSPLLQAWFARTGHRTAADPYFLYAASNVGSLLALVAYPLRVEPHLRLAEQSRMWAGGYALLAALTIGCALAVWRMTAVRTGAGRPTPSPDTASRIAPVTRTRRLRWVLLAFVPSSLMLSVTTYLSTTITPIPLFWVAPLALYLLTFILVFSGRNPLRAATMLRALPLVLMPLVMLLAVRAAGPIWLLIPLHLATFFVAAMVCHGTLAADRPHAAHLTEFYLWMSVGGALGGVFNALVAPVVFTSVLEYPIVLVLLCLLQAPAHYGNGPRSAIRRDVGLPVGLGLLAWGLIVAAQTGGVSSGPLALALVFGLPVLLCFRFSDRPVRFGLGVAAILLAAGAPHTGAQGQVLYAERSFFGIHRVMLDAEAQYHALAHGGTLHGRQSLDPARRREPLTYYTHGGPLGQFFDAAGDTAAPRRVAVIGLGSGSVACYSRPGDDWTFYEIDPAVERIAHDPRYFTFLQDCAPAARVVLGDARLSLAKAADARYDLMILDAYSSDSVPVHLITREALALYQDRLAAGGVLAFHISNKFLDLRPVVAVLAADAGLVAVDQLDVDLTREQAAAGKTGSEWVLIARGAADLGPLTSDPRWQPLTAAAGARPWTDDFSSIIGALRIR